MVKLTIKAYSKTDKKEVKFLRTELKYETLNEALKTIKQLDKQFVKNYTKFQYKLEEVKR